MPGTAPLYLFQDAVLNIDDGNLQLDGTNEISWNITQSTKQSHYRNNEIRHIYPGPINASGSLTKEYDNWVLLDHEMIQLIPVP